MLSIHARNILWGMTKCSRVDATSDTSNKGHIKVKGQTGAFSYYDRYKGVLLCLNVFIANIKQGVRPQVFPTLVMARVFILLYMPSKSF